MPSRRGLIQSKRKSGSGGLSSLIGGLLGAGELGGGEFTESVPEPESYDEAVSQQNEFGTTGGVRSKFTPYEVTHPVLDAIFNRGGAAQQANQYNFQQGMGRASMDANAEIARRSNEAAYQRQQLSEEGAGTRQIQSLKSAKEIADAGNQNQLKNTELAGGITGKNQLANTGLLNQGQLANTGLAGEYQLKNTGLSNQGLLDRTRISEEGATERAGIEVDKPMMQRGGIPFALRSKWGQAVGNPNIMTENAIAEIRANNTGTSEFQEAARARQLAEQMALPIQNFKDSQVPLSPNSSTYIKGFGNDSDVMLNAPSQNQHVEMTGGIPITDKKTGKTTLFGQKPEVVTTRSPASVVNQDDVIAKEQQARALIEANRARAQQTLLQNLDADKARVNNLGQGNSGITNGIAPTIKSKRPDVNTGQQPSASNPGFLSNDYMIELFKSLPKKIIKQLQPPFSY